MRKFLLLTIFAVMSLSVSAQEKGGVVVDADSGEGVPGAVLVLESPDGKMKGYAITDSYGKYTFAEEDFKGCSIAVSHVSYEKSRVEAGSDWHVIRLVPLKQQINEAAVTSEIVKVRPDTITYNAAALTDNTDRTLSDLLKKLPGISVGKNGYVSYQGKPIGKMYIDGKDVLENDYNIVTNNLNPLYVSEIEILERHQPIKALSNLEASENASINIKLKKNRKNPLIVSGNAAAGYAPDDEEFQYSGMAILMNVSGKFQTINALTADNTGQMTAADMNSIRNEEVYDLDKTGQVSTSSAPIGSDHSVFNKTFSLSSINRTPVSDSTYLGFKVNGLYERLSSQTEYDSRYFLHDDGYADIAYLNDASERERSADIDLRLKTNRTAYYFSDCMTFSYSDDDGTSLISGYAGSGQESSSWNMNVYNSLDVIRTLRQGNDIRISNFTQYSRNRCALDVSSEGQDSSLTQVLRNEVFMNRTKATFEKALTSKLYLTSSGELMLRWRKLYSDAEISWQPDLGGNVPGNDMKFFVSDVLGAAGLRYNSKRIQANLSVEAGLRVLSGKSLQEKQSPLAGISSYATLRFSPDWSLHPSFALRYSQSDDRDISSGLIFSDFLHASAGASQTTSLTSGTARMEVRYRNTISSWYVNFGGSFRSSQIRMPSRIITDDCIISSISSQKTPYFSEVISVNASKGFLSSRSKIGMAAGVSMVQSDLLQNDVRSEYSSVMPYVGVSATVTIRDRVKAEYSGRTSLGLCKTDGEWDSSRSLSVSQKAVLTVLLSKKCNAGVTCSHYYDKSGDASGAAVILDAFARYDLGRNWTIFVNASNLMNDSSYRVSGKSPLLDWTQVWRIRPFSILAGISFRI